MRVLQLLYLMAPAYVANMAPPFTRFWRGWNRPISTRWLGTHKTVAGAVVAVAAALAGAWAQSRLAWRGSLLPYEQWPLIGLLLGSGAMGGDLVKSFVKRRRGIAPGARWIPADQLDFVVGALMLIGWWARLSLPDVLVILAVSFVGDIAVNHAACWLHVRDTKW